MRCYVNILMYNPKHIVKNNNLELLSMLPRIAHFPVSMGLCSFLYKKPRSRPSTKSFINFWPNFDSKSFLTVD